ncbi:hypothetical protein, partial [Citrobacter arsenatis]|uniref:hypothetical protein n=1 Tax=Citrobacter arsenatis TaxID=2546350 RepID=UPI00300DD6AE
LRCHYAGQIERFTPPPNFSIVAAGGNVRLLMQNVSMIQCVNVVVDYLIGQRYLDEIKNYP